MRTEQPGAATTEHPRPRERSLLTPEGTRLALTEGTLTLKRGLPLRLGGRIPDCRIDYRLLGAPDAPVVAVMGGISADRRVCAVPGSGGEPGWWEVLVGESRGLDLAHWQVLSIDYLAGPGGSSAPRSDDPAAITALTPGDQADALRAVADQLDLPTMHTVMGASYGGAVALAFAADHADRTRSALVIGAAHRSHPMATAVRSVQRRIVAEARADGRAGAGLALARALAMTTYRSQEEFQQRFDGDPVTGPAGPRFPVEDYLDHQGRVFAERFDPLGFLVLNLSMDLHRIDPHAVRAPVTLVAMEPDAIAPLWQMRELFDQLGPGHELIEVRTSCGHDGFLTDVEVFDPLIRRFLERAHG